MTCSRTAAARLLVWLIVLAASMDRYHAWTPICNRQQLHYLVSTTATSLYDDHPSFAKSKDTVAHTRRGFLTGSAVFAASVLFVPQSTLAAATSSSPSLASSLEQLTQARAQLNPIPHLIQQEKWDAVRNILITPPLSDCWSKTSKLLTSYADAIGAADKDELAALELKEDAVYHLRFLDMAVYNNVFNPIKSEGETGATKELVRSYYEDPPKEYQACVQILDQLIQLASSE